MLPIALARSIRLPLLTADPFTATKWDTDDDKAKFGNHLLRFIAEDFPKPLFTQAFYRRLSNTFGHIAHHNHTGFWDEFFRGRTTKIEFLEQTITHPCYGDPASTYSEVERAVIRRLKNTDILNWHQRLLIQEKDARERAEYDRLARKYAPMTVTVSPQNQAAPMTATDPPRQPAPARQRDLFAGL